MVGGEGEATLLDDAKYLKRHYSGHFKACDSFPVGPIFTLWEGNGNTWRNPCTHGRRTCQLQVEHGAAV